jgi:hypothetical protein
MLAHSDIPDSAYALAWIRLAIVFAYYALVSIALHWKREHKAEVTTYEPPENISPALAAYLFENGRCERAFAAALVSLASKGVLEILEEGDKFALKQLREIDETFPPEESALLTALFPYGLEKYQFNSANTGDLAFAYRVLEKIVLEIAEPDLISAHWVLWLIGVISSAGILIIAGSSLPLHIASTHLLGFAYLCGLVVLSASCFVAALRAWPATLRKLIAYFPGTSHPSLPLNLNDTVPLILTAAALMGFALLAYITSERFALLFSAAVVLAAVFRHYFEAPTSAGRDALVQLRGFREFLARAEADRLDRENLPGHSPEMFEPNSAYAVALNVERGWSENFTASMLQLLQMDRAGTLPAPKLPLHRYSGSGYNSENGRSRGPIQLNINSRK